MTNANVVTWAGRSIYNGYLKATPGMTQPLNIGWGVGGATGTVTGSAFTDVNLFGGVALLTTPESRVAGAANVVTTTNLADTFQVTGTVTALAARAITEVGLFDTNTSLSAQATIATLTTAATSVVIGANTRVLPASNNYYAQIENEVVLVTGGQSTTTLTFTRGAFATANTTHAAGSYITVGGDGNAYLSNTSVSNATYDAIGANGGSMFVHADFAVINLLTNDSIAFTLKVQLS